MASARVQPPAPCRLPPLVAMATERPATLSQARADRAVQRQMSGADTTSQRRAEMGNCFSFFLNQLSNYRRFELCPITLPIKTIGLKTIAFQLLITLPIS